MRLFARALRRAGFKLYLTKGFNPHPVIRIHNALKLGIVGVDQKAECVLDEQLDTKIFKDELERQLPKEIQITKVEVLK
jgi:radical SAM-linked protein